MSEAVNWQAIVTEIRNMAEGAKQAGRRYEAMIKTHPEARVSAKECYGQMHGYSKAADFIEEKLRQARP